MWIVADIQSFEPFWGTWRIVRALGQGSYGKVYLIQREDLGGTYYAALKHLSIPANPQQTQELYADGLIVDEASAWEFYTQMLNTLINEIKVNDRLKGHTNIVSYEEHMITKKTDTPGYDVFIRMEYLTSLSDHIQQRQLTLEDVARLGEDICSALMVLMRERIVHRDIKPANIFVNKGGDFKLGDFGVARTMDKTVSSMSVKGTFAYMAPEVAKGEDGSFGVDIYSLGLVMYKLLNGNRAPFLPPLPAPVTHDDTLNAQRLRFQGDPLPAPAYATPELAEIVLRACAYQPGERWAGPEQMRDALRRYRITADQEDARRVVLSIVKDGSKTGTHGAGSSAVAPSSIGSWNMPSIIPVTVATSPAQETNVGSYIPEDPEENATVVMTPEEQSVTFQKFSTGNFGGSIPAPAPTPMPQNKVGGKKGPLIAVVGILVVVAVAVGIFLLKPDAPSTRDDDPPAVETATPSPEPSTSTATPTPTPTPIPTPTPTPEPSLEATPEPTLEPTPTPTPTPTQKPTAKATPTPKPKKTPKPTPTPAPATPTPAPTPAQVAVSGISLSRNSLILEVGGMNSLSATVTPANATNKTVTWTSSNTAVARVSGSGAVTAVGAGTAVITASCGGHSAICTVSVS